MLYMIWASTINTPSRVFMGSLPATTDASTSICDPNCLPTGVAKPMEHHGTTVPRFCIEAEPKVYLECFSPNSSGAEWGSQFFQLTVFVPS